MIERYRAFNVNHCGSRRADHPYSAFTAFVKRSFARIGPRQAHVSPWTIGMTVLASCAAYLAFLLHFFDGTIIAFIRAHAASPILHMMIWVTNAGKGHWYLISSATVFVSVALADQSRVSRRGRAQLAFLSGQAIFVFATVAGSGLLANLVKLLVGRARPVLFESVGAGYFDPLTAGYAFASFPSGHATTVGAVTAVLMIWFPLARTPLVVLGALIAVTRVVSLSHYPSDVAGGFAGGILFTLFLARWLAARGVVFQVRPHCLFPLPRYRNAFRRRTSGRRQANPAETDSPVFAGR